jgi:hypothetical protein
MKDFTGNDFSEESDNKIGDADPGKEINQVGIIYELLKIANSYQLSIILLCLRRILSTN